MLHSKIAPAERKRAVQARNPSLERRIEELRNRPAVYLNHGEALMLQGMASASLRPQSIVEDKFALDE